MSDNSAMYHICHICQRRVGCSILAIKGIPFSDAIYR